MTPNTENPYAAPVAAVTPSGGDAYDPAEYRRAGNGKRFLNYLVDTFITLVLVFLVTFAMVLGAAYGLSAPMAWLKANGNIAGYVLACSASLLYYVGMEGMFGITLGKLITGCRVVDGSGRKPSLGKVVGRSFARFIPFEPFSFIGAESGGWHDEWSGTTVIDVRNRQPRLPPD